MVTPSFDLYVPTDLRDALKFLESNGGHTAILARGTDLLPRIRRRLAWAPTLLDISGLDGDLRYIKRDDGIVRLGALTTVADLLETDLLGMRLEMIRKAGELFGDPQIRNVATVGGNVCSASSSEDLIPVFLALDAKVKLISSRGERVLPLEGFIMGKRETARKNFEILCEVFFEAPRGNCWSGFEKLGRRNILIVSLVSEALLLTLEDDLETIRGVKVALNRVAGKVPARAAKAEAFLSGRKLTPEVIREAQDVLASELALKGDFRASGEYRAELAKVFLKRLLLGCASRIRGG